jgi:hypothetical protein
MTVNSIVSSCPFCPSPSPSLSLLFASLADSVGVPLASCTVSIPSASTSAPVGLVPSQPLWPNAVRVSCTLTFTLRVPKAPSDESVAGEGAFHPRVTRYLPDGFLRMDKQCFNNIISRTIRMSTDYSPSSKAAPSLLETLPAVLSQALSLCPGLHGYEQIPHPGFNGHKPTSFIEGEGQLDASVTNEINEKGLVECSPIAPEAVIGQSQAVKLREWLEQAVLGLSGFLLLWICMDSLEDRKSLACNTGVVNMRDDEAEASHIPGPLAEHSCTQTELVPWAQPELLLPAVVDQYPKHLDMTRVADRALQDLRQVPKLPPYRRHTLSGLKLDRRLRWKPPDLKELRQHITDVVRLRDDRMSRPYSPGIKMALAPFVALLYPCPPYGLWDIATVR